MSSSSFDLQGLSVDALSMFFTPETGSPAGTSDAQRLAHERVLNAGDRTIPRILVGEVSNPTSTSFDETSSL